MTFDSEQKQTTMWKVIHNFGEPISVHNKVDSYESEHIKLSYEDNKLTKVEHEIFGMDNCKHDQVIERSKEELSFFWDFLQYQREMPLPTINSITQKIQSSIVSPAIGLASASFTIRWAVEVAIRLPSEQFFSTRDDRLPIWIRLVNDAVSSRNAIHGIRNYHMICEDLFPSGQKRPEEANAIRLIRHFVSHGKKKLSKDVLDFIASKLGKQVDGFDPKDRQQIDFVTIQCVLARKFIKDELDKLIK